MRVRVLLFGPLAARLGRREDCLDLPAGAAAVAVYHHYARADAGLGVLGRDLQLAVNAQFAPPETLLAEGDEVALLPPMSGGSAASAAPPADCVELLRGPLPAAALRAAVAAPGHGGVVVFEGVTRADPIAGHPVLYLEYEAYEPMARQQMRELAAAARQRWPIGAVAIAHRLGRVAVGETSVIIAVGAAHRQPAFAACAWAISELKRVVPIWKRECTAAGGRWSAGNAFPGASDTPER